MVIITITIIIIVPQNEPDSGVLFPQLRQIDSLS